MLWEKGWEAMYALVARGSEAEVLRPEMGVVFSKQKPLVEVCLVGAGNRRTMTVIKGLNGFGLDEQAYARRAMRAYGASATVAPPAAGSGRGGGKGRPGGKTAMDVKVQGDKVREVAADLVGVFAVPTQCIVTKNQIKGKKKR